MNDNVKALLNEQLWYLGTYGKDANVVPVAFKRVEEDGTLTVGDVFLETTLRNIAANGKIAVAVTNAATMEGYQIKGTATYVKEGPLVDDYKRMVEAMFKGAASAKGALIIKAERVIVTTPGADNKKEL